MMMALIVFRKVASRFKVPEKRAIANGLDQLRRFANYYANALTDERTRRSSPMATGDALSVDNRFKTQTFMTFSV